MPKETLKFDFSQFHDLGHSIWQCLWECWLKRNLYGGWQHHLRLAWTYQWEGELRCWTTCRLGRHSPPNPMWRGQPHPFKREDGSWSRPPERYICAHCWVDLPPPPTSRAQ